MNYQKIVGEKKQKLQERSLYVQKIYEKNNHNLKELFMHNVNRQMMVMSKQNEFLGGKFIKNYYDFA